MFSGGATAVIGWNNPFDPSISVVDEWDLNGKTTSDNFQATNGRLGLIEQQVRR